VEYKYDGVGRLVGRTDADGEQIFVQAGWSMVTESDQEGRRTYYTSSSAKTETNQQYFLFNHRGDTIAVSDKDGNISDQLYYEAYGPVTDTTGSPITPTPSSSLPPLFVGSYGIRYDRKTELSYMRFRWYDYCKMRFISSDSLLSQNRYAYASSNPLKHIDPTGLFTFEGVAEYFSSVPGGQQYADIINQSQGTNFIRTNVQLHLTIEGTGETSFFYLNPTKPRYLGYTKPTVVNDKVISNYITIPLWFNNQMAAATLVEELDHQKFNMNSANRCLNEEEYIFQREFNGHLSRIDTNSPS
jgi:RHS repeat-associated protein